MTALPSPVAVPAGHVVRVIVFKYTYTSPVMSPAEAAGLAQQLQAEVDRIGAAFGFVPGLFATADGRLIRLRARNINTIEVGPPPALQDKPAAPVFVHVHLGSPEIPEEVAEATAGYVPTPMALAALKQRR